jgi:hypothetical protein
MLTTLSRARPAILIVLALSGLAVVTSLFLATEHFLMAATITHTALYLFVVTEAFGPVAHLRSKSIRTFARVVLIPYTVLMLIVAISHVTAAAAWLSRLTGRLSGPA